MFNARASNCQAGAKRQRDAEREQAKRQRMATGNTVNPKDTLDNAHIFDAKKIPSSIIMDSKTWSDFSGVEPDQLCAPVIVTDCHPLIEMQSKDEAVKKQITESWASFRAHPQRETSQLKVPFAVKEVETKVLSALHSCLKRHRSIAVPDDDQGAGPLKKALTLDMGDRPKFGHGVVCVGVVGWRPSGRAGSVGGSVSGFVSKLWSHRICGRALVAPLLRTWSKVAWHASASRSRGAAQSLQLPLRSLAASCGPSKMRRQ